jgi:predicted ArsR family transcriptional regulator
MPVDEGGHRDTDAGIDAAASLAEPLRRRLYDFVVNAGAPVGRDEAAAHAGIGRSLAAYHLDQLVTDGILATSFERRTGRSGPGAGRPAKLYMRAPVEIVVQLPARDDTLVAHLLASAIETDTTGRARNALREITRGTGKAIRAQLKEGTTEELLGMLRDRGYEPMCDDEGIRLRNCPFHHLVDDHLDLVCNLNKELLSAVVGGSRTGYTAHLDPRPGQCCVVLRPASTPQS